MIYVVTGQPRHGKSQYVMKMILDFIEQNKEREKQGKQAREIYCDIAGINAPSTPTQLPSVQNQWAVFGDTPLWFGEHDDKAKPDDFICPKAGSIFIYDECHKVDWIKDSTGMLSKHETTMSMNEHGHEDFIFVLITQFPQYIHTHLRGLVEFHYHAKRFNALNQSKIYKWNEFKTTPRSKSTMDDVFEKETFKFNKKYYNCYKSASAHDSMKFKMPKEWTIALLGISFLIAIMVWRYNTSPIKAMVQNGETDIIKANEQARLDENGQPLDNQAETQTEQQKILALQNEIQDLKTKYLADHIVELTKSPDILPVSVVSNDETCMALNEYGELLAIDDSICRKMVNEFGMMPKSRELETDKGSDGQTVQKRTVEPI